MNFEPQLVPALLHRRYKRFLADVELEDGTTLTVHCPNTGSMKGCVVAGSRCWISDSGNAKRKYRHTWELATTESGHLAGINTGRANKLVVEAITSGVAREFSGFDQMKTERRYGSENSRIDVWLRHGDLETFIEVKSVTLADVGGCGLFPDAVSDRASRHVRELIAAKRDGHRAVMFFCIQHTGIEVVSPADQIDPAYGIILREAAEQGVEAIAYRAEISEKEIALVKQIPVVL